MRVWRQKNTQFSKCTAVLSIILYIYVPIDVLNMPSLWLLDLSHNEIETLPEVYPDGLYYGEILLNGNKLISVPDNLGRLKNIEYLSLAHNKLLYVPAVAFRSEASINVDHNPFLNYVPATIKYILIKHIFICLN